MAGSRQSWAWALVLLALSAGAALAAQAHGVGSRATFQPPAELAGRRWGTVDDAAAAYGVWEAAPVRGRRLVVLTGRWSRPRSLRDAPPTQAELSGGSPAVDVDSALFAAARAGIARRLDVVMPPEAYQRRRAEVLGQKDLELREGSFALHYEGLERVFSRPGSYRAPAEAVLLLIEPSWFQPGAPEPLAGWLAAVGLTTDLALVALDDPAADDAQREAARRLGAAMGAAHLEAAR